ncbi:MAG: glutathione S-transferase [Comamonadaceae bacterium BICA1-1]|nr:MAG: glutathione S-transferase [Comamonadaceae bacterium BICA1-1]
MTDIVLHNYAFSPFSEKIRTTLGLKRIAWRSVDVAPLPPRPLLAALTGGYRRIPVLQIGADIYCDTNAILPALERLQPEPSLYPNDCEGLARGMAFAWERAVLIPTIGVLVHYIGDALPPEFIKDRKEGFLGIDISKPAMAPELPHHLQVLHAQYSWLKSALAAARVRGHDFLFGPTPSVLDLACWQTTFLLRKNSPPEVDVLAGLQGLEAWYDRLAAVGHGHVTPMMPEEALAAAAAARPAPVTHLRPDGDPAGLKPGAAVVVTPDDNARVPVHGTLVAASDAQVVIHRHDSQAGDLHLHFPRLGFDVLPA